MKRFTSIVDGNEAAAAIAYSIVTDPALSG
jgi:hypothetical protein